jgi:hypothetical protein
LPIGVRWPNGQPEAADERFSLKVFHRGTKGTTVTDIGLVKPTSPVHPWVALRSGCGSAHTLGVQMWRLIVLGLIAALVFHYARYFLLVRQEVPTILQICLLLAAAAIAAIPVRAAWKVTQLQAWMTALVAAGLSVAIFVWADRDSHSVSDTLNRAVPAIFLAVAVAVRIAIWRHRSAGFSTQGMTLQ